MAIRVNLDVMLATVTVRKAHAGAGLHHTDERLELEERLLHRRSGVGRRCRRRAAHRHRVDHGIGHRGAVLVLDLGDQRSGLRSGRDQRGAERCDDSKPAKGFRLRREMLGSEPHEWTSPRSDGCCQQKRNLR
mgnify:CR=1 FL=1